MEVDDDVEVVELEFVTTVVTVMLDELKVVVDTVLLLRLVVDKVAVVLE